MGRHSSGAPQPPARSSPRPPARPAAGVRTRGRGRRRRIVALLLTVLVLLGAATAAGWAAVASGRVDSLWGSSPDCDPTRVRVAAAPEAAAVLRQALGGPTGPGSDRCVDVVVRAQPPAATAAASRTAPATRWPQVWVPDSSLWAAQAPGFSTTKVSTLGTSPLVVATNKATAAALGWDHSPPTWAGALRGVRPVVVPDLGTDARGLTAVLALRESLGGGTVADRAVAAAALASARGGEAAPDAVADIPPDGSTAPLVPLTEQQVVRADRSRPGSIVAVYPKGGSPSLDYPVLRVPAAAATTKQRRAVGRVLDVLRSSRTMSLAGAAAFRDAHGTGSLAPTKKPVKPVPLPDAATVQQLLLRLQALAAPSRILALLDVSTSMRAPVGNGQNRAQVLRDAAIGAVGLMRGEDQVGAWVFAADLTAGHDYAPLVGVQPLRVPEAGATHRDQVVASLRALPAHLKPGGTGLYQTVRDAVLTMQKSYDPRASNVVVVLTDGQNDRSKGPTLSALLGTLRSTADPKRPVRVIAVGISGDADMAALTRIAAATPGGRAYLAERPSTLQTVLFDALTNR